MLQYYILVVKLYIFNSGPQTTTKIKEFGSQKGTTPSNEGQSEAVIV